ncbi:MAG TPA: AzlC family ABC transporter permease [Gammaproteobacteria bacterium]|nr:AzlC family ABC transporter permease [Gammaproteobacteria bacterium]
MSTDAQQSPPGVGPAFWRGYRDCSPFILVVAPFGLLFGAVASDAGLNLLETMTMTILVIAGAAQFTALALLQEHAPTLIVIAAALAVNLRMAMYSAALVPHIGSATLLRRAFASYFVVDQVFAVSVKAFDFDGGFSVAQKIAFIVGAGSAIFPFWIGCTLAGALVGNAIPPEFSLDFAIPICFISITAPMMRSLPHLVAAIVSITVALALAWLPYYLWLMVAALLAMIAGAQTELWLQRRSA